MRFYVVFARITNENIFLLILSSTCVCLPRQSSTWYRHESAEFIWIRNRISS